MSFKRIIVFGFIMAIAATTLQGCFLRKNKCDSCPGIMKYKKTKKVRKSSKGSI